MQTDGYEKPFPAEEIPSYLEPFPGAENITIGCLDIDNNLIPYTDQRVAGVMAMPRVIHEWVKTMNKWEKIDETQLTEQVFQNMGYVYNAFSSFDVPYLTENMPIVYQSLFKILERYKDPRKAIMHIVLMFSRLMGDTLDAYRSARNTKYKPYPFIPQVLEIMTTRMRLFGITDAPLGKSVKRLHELGLDKYLTIVFGQPSPKFQFKDKRTEDEHKQEEENEFYEYLQLLKEVHENIPPHEKPEKWRQIIAETNLRVVELLDSRKPHLDLPKIIPLNPGERIPSNCVVIGDNPEKDAAQGINSDCYVILNKGGWPQPEDRDKMKILRVDQNVYDRYFANPSDIVKSIKEGGADLGVDFNPNKLAVANHCLQWPDLLGLKRPPNCEPKK